MAEASPAAALAVGVAAPSDLQQLLIALYAVLAGAEFLESIGPLQTRHALPTSKRFEQPLGCP